MILLMGTKMDSIKREITTEQGMTIAKQNKTLFCETSAYTSDNIEVAITQLAEELYKTHQNTIGSNSSQQKKATGISNASDAFDFSDMEGFERPPPSAAAVSGDNVVQQKPSGLARIFPMLNNSKTGSNNGCCMM